MARLTLSVALLAAGCASSAPPPRAHAATARIEPRRSPEPPIVPPDVSPCEHALRCCDAFQRSVLPPGAGPASVALCDALRQSLREVQPVEACKAMIGAWRTSLRSLDRAIPAACGGPS